MQDAGDRALLAQDPRRCVVGAQDMNDEWFSGFAGSADVGAKRALLQRVVGCAAIEPALADRYCIARCIDQSRSQIASELVSRKGRNYLRMNAEREPDPGGRMAAGQLAYAVPGARADRRDQKTHDAGRGGAGEHLVAVEVERRQVEMAVRVDQLDRRRRRGLRRRV
jgi:hypothetical protein